MSKDWDLITWPWSWEGISDMRTHSGPLFLYILAVNPSSQSYGFSSSHVWIWELDHKEDWVPRNWCFRTVGLKKTLKIPWTARRSNQSTLKGYQPWIFIGRTNAETEAPILWPPDAKSQHTGKDPDAGNDWGQEEKGATEDESMSQHHWVNGHEFE